MLAQEASAQPTIVQPEVTAPASDAAPAKPQPSSHAQITDDEARSVTVPVPALQDAGPSKAQEAAVSELQEDAGQQHAKLADSASTHPEADPGGVLGDGMDAERDESAPALSQPAHTPGLPPKNEILAAIEAADAELAQLQEKLAGLKAASSQDAVLMVCRLPLMGRKGSKHCCANYQIFSASWGRHTFRTCLPVFFLLVCHY